MRLYYDELEKLYKKAEKRGMANDEVLNHEGEDIVVQNVVAAMAHLAVHKMNFMEFSCPCVIGSTCWPKCRE